MIFMRQYKNMKKKIAVAKKKMAMPMSKKKMGAAKMMGTKY